MGRDRQTLVSVFAVRGFMPNLARTCGSRRFRAERRIRAKQVPEAGLQSWADGVPEFPAVLPYSGSDWGSDRDFGCSVDSGLAVAQQDSAEQDQLPAPSTPLVVPFER